VEPNEREAHELLAEFRRLGVVTPEEFASARPRVRPIGPLVRMMPRDMTAILRRLPNNAGPVAVRDLSEAALAEYHGFPILQADA